KFSLQFQKHLTRRRAGRRWRYPVILQDRVGWISRDWASIKMLFTYLLTCFHSEPAASTLSKSLYPSQTCCKQRRRRQTRPYLPILVPAFRYTQTLLQWHLVRLDPNHSCLHMTRRSAN